MTGVSREVAIRPYFCHSAGWRLIKVVSWGHIPLSHAARIPQVWLHEGLSYVVAELVLSIYRLFGLHGVGLLVIF